MQTGQAAQRGRHLAGQPVVGEVQYDDAAVAVGSDAVPFVKRGFAEPVIIIVPIFAIGGLVDCR